MTAIYPERMERGERTALLKLAHNIAARQVFFDICESWKSMPYRFVNVQTIDVCAFFPIRIDSTSE